VPTGASPRAYHRPVPPRRKRASAAAVPAEPPRLEVTKTYKLFIGGAFPRSESSRSLPIRGRLATTARRGPTGGVGKLARDANIVIAHISHASRKDLRDAVEAARKAFPGWAAAMPYNRGQVLYRMAEMMEGKRAELEQALAAVPGVRSPSGARSRSRASQTSPAFRSLPPAREVALAIDRIVAFGGWADKYAQVLGCNNPVAGPYYNFTTPEPCGIVAIVAPDEAPLLALVTLLAPALCAGNAAVAIASDANPLPAAILGEVCATSDIPPGVVNLLTGRREELIPHIASHRDIDAIHAAGLPAADAKTLQQGSADNVKRVTIRGAVDWADETACISPWWVEPLVEFKTIWHPSAT
jgi:acyl-CoA reductase-like NAD-dependent aldehyde dehydrogenase